MSKIFFVMPAYNEAENIETTFKQWYPVVEKAGEDCRLVIANDGSKDNTVEIMKALQPQYPQFVLLDKSNSGHGSTVLYLYRYAVENGADFIFQTDSDGQTNPDEFDGFLEASKEFDCVMGNRVVRGDGKDRKMVENILRCFCWFFFGAMVPDANAPFRLMKTSVVEKYLPVMPEDFNLPNAVLASCFKRFNERVTYRVITFKPRQGGANSINMKRIFKIGWKALSDFRKIRVNLRKL